MKVKPNPQSKDDVVNNPYSWNANANLLFVDQVRCANFASSFISCAPLRLASRSPWAPASATAAGRWTT